MCKHLLIHNALYYFLCYYYSFIGKYWAKQTSCGLKRPKQATIHHAGVKGGSAGEKQTQSPAYGGPRGTTALQEVKSWLTGWLIKKDMKMEVSKVQCSSKYKLFFRRHAFRFGFTWGQMYHLMCLQWSPRVRAKHGGNKPGHASAVRTRTQTLQYYRGEQREEHYSETVSVCLFLHNAMFWALCISRSILIIK